MKRAALLLTAALLLLGAGGRWGEESQGSAVYAFRFSAASLAAASTGACMRIYTFGAALGCSAPVTSNLDNVDFVLPVPTGAVPTLLGITCELPSAGGTWDVGDKINVQGQWRDGATDALTPTTAFVTITPTPAAGDMFEAVVNEASPYSGPQSLRMLLTTVDTGVVWSAGMICTARVRVPL